MSWAYFIFLATAEAEAMKSNFNSLRPAATMRTGALSQILYLLPGKNVPVALAMEVGVRSSDIKQLSSACQGPIFLCVECFSLSLSNQRLKMLKGSHYRTVARM